MSANDPQAGAGDELYVGYLPTPRRHVRLLRWCVPALLWALVAVAGALMFARRDAGPGVWKLEQPVSYEGLLRCDPYPMLEIDGEGDSRVLMLVEAGKIGAQSRAKALDLFVSSEAVTAYG